jgi:NUMOD3 motif
MDYHTHYWTLIGRAQIRKLDGYCERHHIVPKCMGGSNADSNIVELSPEEHYIAHQLLMKMFPSIVVLSKATAFMAQQCIGNKAHGWIRRRAAEAVSISNSNREWTDASRLKVARPGESNPFFGKTHSIATIDIIRAKRATQILPDRTTEQNRKLSMSKRKLNDEQIAEAACLYDSGISLRDLMISFDVSYQIMYRMLRPICAMRHGNIGRHQSESTKLAISAASSGRKHSIETRQKMSIARYKWHEANAHV